MKTKQNVSQNAFLVGEDEVHKQNKNEINSNGAIYVRIKYQNMQLPNRNELNNKDQSLSLQNFLSKTKQLKYYAHIENKKKNSQQRHFKNYFNIKSVRNNPIIKAMMTKKKKPSQKAKANIYSYNKQSFNKSSILFNSHINTNKNENNIHNNVLSHNLYNSNSTKQLHSSISYSTYDVNDRKLKLLNSNNSCSNINNNISNSNNNKHKSSKLSMEYNSKIQLQPYHINHYTNSKENNNTSTSNILHSKVQNSKEKEVKLFKSTFPIKQLKIPILYKKPKNTQINEYNGSLYCQYYSKKSNLLRRKDSQDINTKCALFDNLQYNQKGKLARNRPRTSWDNGNQRQLFNNSNSSWKEIRDNFTIKEIQPSIKVNNFCINDVFDPQFDTHFLVSKLTKRNNSAILIEDKFPLKNLEIINRTVSSAKKNLLI